MVKYYGNITMKGVFVIYTINALTAYIKKQTQHTLTKLFLLRSRKFPLDTKISLQLNQVSLTLLIFSMFCFDLHWYYFYHYITLHFIQLLLKLLDWHAS